VRFWGALAIVTHFIPDIYIFAVLRQPSPFLVDGLILVIALLAIIAVIGVMRQIQRRERESLKVR
jgi:hypothetical protein